MKKITLGLCLLLLLTGCWDQLPLRDIHLLDIVGLDLDEGNKNVMVDFVVTRLMKTGQGQGEPISETTELKGASVVEAVGQGVYHSRGPFLGISTRVYLMSEKFASHVPTQKLAFLLHAPYSSINTPVVLVEGSVSHLLKNISGTKSGFTDQLNDFVMSLETNGVMSNVSMMHFILSGNEPFEDTMLPLVVNKDEKLEMSGALLFRQGMSTNTKLNVEQVRTFMFLLETHGGRNSYTGNLTESELGREPITGSYHGREYAYVVKRADSKIIVQSERNRIPIIHINVKLAINVFDVGQGLLPLKPDHINRMEQSLSRHLEEISVRTFKILQQANCDVLGIHKQLISFHPKLWRSLDWRKDYPQVSIKPHFNIQILNAEVEK
ncbi:Ger(x)C family spore germination C-terminal domain-containing protein [Paenibacillus guangzhouensis]|uniref:Ger(x)C family spore germination C-terminal domain-containing protein n=1 Tax=Paenibacillus guangzhouensis TaxID=1473112 RepID=UPI001266D118|nr:Ger(x)C family spore germination C-terminal domain-containing protein [Paenibacillus guangzhouensis]